MNTTQLIDSQGNVDYNRISLFSVADYGATFSYARKLKLSGLQYGVNSKIIRRIIGKFASSWGFGFDAGLQWERNNWKFGLIIAITFLIGGFVGSKLSLKLSPSLVQIIFGLIMAYVSFRLLFAGFSTLSSDES
jgi:hypothetical protein